MKSIHFDYSHCPTIKRFSESDKFVRALMGPFGSGKSSGCAIEIPQLMMAQEPSTEDGIRKTRFAIIRNTYSQLEDTTIKTVLDWLPEDHFGTYVKSDRTYYVTKLPGCYAEIMFRALDKPDDIKKLLSLELTHAWINEAREIPWAVVEGLMGRVGRYPSKREGGATRFGIVMDTNPPDADSKFYKYFEEIKPDNAEIFKQPSGLSPQAENLPNLPPGYYSNLAVGKDDEWVKVYIKGEYGFVVDGKPVYPEYNDSIHCKDIEPIKGLTIYRGWDFGLTPACVFTQILPSGQWLIFDELIADNLGADRFSDDVVTHTGRHYPDFTFEDIGDPAGEQRAQTDEKTCFEILRAKGINIEGGAQDLGLRIESVKKALNTLTNGKPNLLLHSRCKMLRKGFQGGYQYRRMQTSAERYTDKPDKNNYSHPHDALQYPATRLFGSALMAKKNATIDYRKLYK